MFDLDEIRGKTIADIPTRGLPEELRGQTPDQLHQSIQIIDAKLRDLHQGENGELRDLSEAEDQAFQYLVELRKAAVKRLEEHRNLIDVLQQETPSVKRAFANIRRGLDGVSSVARMPAFEARDMALRTLDDRTSSAHLRSEEKDQIERHIRTNADVARRILVTETEAYRSAWMKAVTDPQGLALLDDEERNAMRAYVEYRAASSTANAGGYGVPVERELVAA